MALLVDRDQQILLSDPGYPCNRHFVRVLEGEPVGVPVGPLTNYQLSADLIEAAWSTRTRGVLIASPSNPTGTQVPPDELRRIAATCARLGRRLIVDEIYLGLTYDGRAANRAGCGRRTRRRHLRRVELLQVLQHDGVAPGLGHRSRAARPRSRKARAEPLHLSDRPFRSVRRSRVSCPARSRCWKSGGAPSASAAISSCRRCASWASAFRCGRAEASSCTPTARALPPTVRSSAAICCRPRVWRLPRDSISAAIAPKPHVRFAYTIEMAKLEDGVSRLRRHLRDR